MTLKAIYKLHNDSNQLQKQALTKSPIRNIINSTFIEFKDFHRYIHMDTKNPSSTTINSKIKNKKRYPLDKNQIH